MVIRVWDFHTSMTYLGTIGSAFKDSGFEDILIEPDIVAPGSIKGILSDHHYNRIISANKMMYEALGRFRWKTFIEASSADECDSVHDLTKALNDVGPTMKLYDITQQDRSIEKERLENSIFDYWSLYIDMVQGLLLFLLEKEIVNCIMHPFVKYCTGSLPMIV